MNKKICLLTDSLSSGGAEKVAANMSLSLTKKGYQVFIVCMQDNIHYQFGGTLFNFGKVKAKHNRLKAFLQFKSFFKDENFDIVIDHRVRNTYFKELIFSRLVFRNYKVVYCIHSHCLPYYFSFINLSSLAILSHVKQRTFVVVGKEIQKYLYLKLNIKSKVIYNYISDDICPLDNQEENNINNYIVGVGRLNKLKQFDKLIKSYSKSKLPEKNIKLLIIGDGEEKQSLKQLIINLNINNEVELIPFKNNPYNIIKNAKALVLTSKVEGFPMVLLEALTLKTPVIAFNCKSGPDEIIKHGENGLLVENQNEEQLTMALNKLLLDNDFYNNVKDNAHVGLEKFSEEQIIQEWISLLDSPI